MTSEIRVTTIKNVTVAEQASGRLGKMGERLLDALEADPDYDKDTDYAIVLLRSRTDGDSGKDGIAMLGYENMDTAYHDIQVHASVIRSQL